MNANRHIPFSVSVVFRTRREIEKGESTVAILGSDKVFGQWETKNAAYARRAGDNFWEVVVFLSHGSRVKWTWVTIDRWGNLREREARPTRNLVVSGDSLKITAFWNQEMEVKQLWPGDSRQCIPPDNPSDYTENDDKMELVLNYQEMSPVESYLKYNENYIRSISRQQPTTEFEAIREANRRGLYLNMLQDSDFGGEMFNAQFDIDTQHALTELESMEIRQRIGQGDATPKSCRPTKAAEKSAEGQNGSVETTPETKDKDMS